MNELDEDLFQKGRDKVKQSRSEKRAEKRRREQLQLSEPPIEVVDLPVTDRLDMDISSTMLKELQATDPTLKKIRDSVSSEFGVGFYFRDGFIYRRWILAGREGDAAAVEQLVLPQKCRRTVMMSAHSIPMAGHLGKDKTAKRVLQRFYWPTLYQDVAKFCRCCGECQKATGRRQVRAPLVPLPIITQPFSRISMDIVGPLPLSRQGNRYILVVCDYATRYLEAVALRNIDAETIAEELVTIFSRVGIPQEILTDQGANFTS